MITLYHGTSARHLPSILKSGLQPRGFHKNSNWAGKIISKKDFVYLTDAYPVYFAWAAAKADEDLVIIRVEVDEKQLYPDEDYIALCLKTHDPFCKNIPLDEIGEMINLEDYRRNWVESLKFNGKVAIKGVTSKQITGHIVIKHDDMNAILATGGDSVPSPLPYKILGGQYRQVIGVMFENGVEAAVQFVRSERERQYKDVLEKGEMVI
ncbi:MAG: hypothetical protein M0R32_02535 [Candidatus Cloacimonetes bacterium]|jgi:hypothetical protein|nr:hypothetical protein [Candidatus Cloacimonadota bacterium]